MKLKSGSISPKLFLLVLIPIASLVLSGCTLSGSGKWTGFYYPFGTGGKTIYSPLDGFSTHEACMDWVDAQHEAYGNPSSGDWECGKSCKLSEDFKTIERTSPEEAAALGPFYICDETV